MRAPLIVLIALIPLAACSTVREVVNGPSMTPVGYPAALVPQNQEIAPMASSREPLPQPASANSLWRTGARAFFIDQRASRVGDILTVQIDIDDSAKTQNTTNAQRTSGIKAGVPHLLGLESSLGKILPGGFDPANAVETNSTSANSGSGS